MLKKTHSIVCSLLLSIALLSCHDENSDLLTEEIQEIESQYSRHSGPKLETKAPAWSIDEMEAQMEQEINAAMAQRTAGRTMTHDYDMGLILPPGTVCPGEIITFYFDNENNAPNSSGTRYSWSGTGAWPWEITQSDPVLARIGDLTMKFCRVSGADYNNSIYRYPKAHAVLKLGALNIPGSTPVLRYFDNEDDSKLSTATGNIYPNGLDSSNKNIALFFHNFPAKTNSIYIRHNTGLGVFAERDDANGYQFTYFIDNEDTKNANYWKINGTKLQSYNSPYMSGGLNSAFSLLILK